MCVLVVGFGSGVLGNVIGATALLKMVESCSSAARS